MSETLSDALHLGLDAPTPRRSRLKGAGGLARGVSGRLGSERAASAARSTQATPMGISNGKRPNIVMIMTDDVGWGDLGCYGGGPMRGAPTPYLDRLAAEGMRFANHYGQTSCTAGRASFITSRIPIRTALALVLVPGDPDHLTPETPTVAQFLRDRRLHHGATRHKWQLGVCRRRIPSPTESTRCITCSPTTPASMPTATRI